jgi:hypothetical protein
MSEDLRPDPMTRRVVEIARAMLTGQVSFIEGSRGICEVVPGGLRDDPDIIAFVLIDSETDALPVGAQQKLWQPKALEDLRPRIEQAEQWAKTTATAHCRNLIVRFGSI